MVLTDLIARMRRTSRSSPSTPAACTPKPTACCSRRRSTTSVRIRVCLSRAARRSRPTWPSMASTASTTASDSARPAATCARSSRCSARWPASAPGSPACAARRRSPAATCRQQEFDAANDLVKFNPLADWGEREVWAYIRAIGVPYNALHDRGFPSIGCEPCTRAVAAGRGRARRPLVVGKPRQRRNAGCTGAVRRSAEANASAASVKSRSDGRARPRRNGMRSASRQAQRRAHEEHAGDRCAETRGLEAPDSRPAAPGSTISTGWNPRPSTSCARWPASAPTRSLLFSGGKDSICLLRLAEKAFRPGRFPFPLLHIDTGHNYPEVIEFRDRRAAATRRAPDRALGGGLDGARHGACCK